MAVFPICHGLTISPNGYIENLEVESFTNTEESSLTELRPGRIWYNSDEKTYKVVVDDGSGGTLVLELLTSNDKGITVQDEGVELGQNINTVNFVGLDVTSSLTDTTSITVTIPSLTKEYTYASSSPSTVHNITHNLGSYNILGDVLEYDSDGSWSPVWCKISYTSLNSCTIELTESVDIIGIFRRID